jgi:hypothetical protein
MTVTNREMESVFFRFWQGALSLQDFEQWLYATPELEDYLGASIYCEFISFDFHQPDAGYELRKLIEKQIDFPRFYTWDIQRLLEGLFDDSQDAAEIFEALYQQYGLYRFLDPLNHAYLLGIDEIPKLKQRDLWNEAAFRQQRKMLTDQVAQLKPKIAFLLQALEAGKIKINWENEYEIKRETEKQLKSKHL